jgi:hypothetical protein
MVVAPVGPSTRTFVLCVGVHAVGYVLAGMYSTPEVAAVDVRTGAAACPVGSYCVAGVRYACSSGRYGDAVNMTASGCTGQCFAGYVCAGIGNTNGTAAVCGSAAVYCPPGSSVPSPVSPGFYSAGGTSAATRTTQVTARCCLVARLCSVWRQSSRMRRGKLPFARVVTVPCLCHVPRSAYVLVCVSVWLADGFAAGVRARIVLHRGDEVPLRGWHLLRHRWAAVSVHKRVPGGLLLPRGLIVGCRQPLWVGRQVLPRGIRSGALGGSGQLLHTRWCGSVLADRRCPVRPGHVLLERPPVRLPWRPFRLHQRPVILGTCVLCSGPVV